MGDCTFDISFNNSAAELVEKARQSIANAGGEVSGDLTSGIFNIPSPLGKISGTYTITQQSANFHITEKPLFVGCGLIESTIKKYLSQETLS
jgi:hypothetical protein